MKKLFAFMLAFALSMGLATNNVRAETKSYELSGVTKVCKMAKGETIKLYLKGYTTKKKHKQVKWKSSKKRVTTVSSTRATGRPVDGEKGTSMRLRSTFLCRNTQKSFTLNINKSSFKQKTIIFDNEKIKMEASSPP